MQYWVIKSNPNKYEVEQALADYGNDGFLHWSVSPSCKTGDIVFIGQSGSEASILMEGELTSDPILENDGTDDDPYWLDKEEAKKPRWRADVKIIEQCLKETISEGKLRATGLNRVADFLHRQGRSLRLSASEANALEALFQ